MKTELLPHQPEIQTLGSFLQNQSFKSMYQTCFMRLSTGNKVKYIRFYEYTEGYYLFIGFYQLTYKDENRFQHIITATYLVMTG